MNLEELKTKYPKVFQAAVEDGVKLERDRVCGHIQLGRDTGATKTALDAIKRGLTMTPALFTAYTQAARAHIELEARLEDDDVVLSALENVKLPKSKFTDPKADAAKEVLHRLQTMLDTSADDGRIEDLDEVDQ